MPQDQKCEKSFRENIALILEADSKVWKRARFNSTCKSVLSSVIEYDHTLIIGYKTADYIFVI
jgi:hypothetical protein